MSPNMPPEARCSVQLALPGCGYAARILPRCSRHRQNAAPPNDALITSHVRRMVVQGHAPKGIACYRYQLCTALVTAERLAGRRVTWVELFHDVHLLGRVLIDDTAPVRGTQLSLWSLAQRRSAVRSLATLMHPELAAHLGRDPHGVVDQALRLVAERVGTGYRLSGGAPRRRGGRVPTSSDIAAVLDAAGRARGFRGARNRAFLSILAQSGARVNALRHLDGADCVALPSGRLRLYLHEKGKREPREVELSREAADALRAYMLAFNRAAGLAGWSARVRLGEPGPVWRNSGRGCWSYRDIAATLRSACVDAGVPLFSPHALRRAFATDAASLLPRHVVALAGGWQGLERLDDHYVHPRAGRIWQKLALYAAHENRPMQPNDDLLEDAKHDRDPAPTL